MCIFHHLLVELLFSNVNGKSLARVNSSVEFVEFVVDLGLGDCFVIYHDVVIDVADGDPVYTLVGVFECSKHPFFERGGSSVDCGAICVKVLGPVDIQYLVFISDAFALGHIHTGQYVRIRWGYIGGWVVEISISSVEKSRCF